MKIARKGGEKVWFGLSIFWKCSHWSISTILPEDIAEGGDAVCEDNISATEYRVVAYCLVEHTPIDTNIWLLALHNDHRLGIAAYGNYIGALRHAIDIYGVLLDNLLGLKTTLQEHILNHMAAYPLLRRKH